MPKIITIIGARPQFIKAAVVSREFSKTNIFKEILVHTGQHFDKNMSDIFFEEMEIPTPHYNLNINGLSHGAMTGQMLEGIEKVCLIEKPDYVMVYGDTNSTIAGALAAKKMGISVIHVEAGLRSFNMNMPEEINRILTDRISDILFCPTDTSIDNLKADGIVDGNIKVIKNGDVMQDAAIYYAQKSSEKSNILSQLNLKHNEFVLSTIHRQENTDSPKRLNGIINALNQIAENLPVVVPIHPRTRNIISRDNLDINFTMIDPIGYFDMIELLKKCRLVLTDSGGLQKEAYFFDKYCITLRDETEWVELIQNGFNQLAGADKLAILNAFQQYLTKPFDKHVDLYGGGKASVQIRHTLESLIN
jgi:UDP-GlcNAc3NAcA epimerase